MTGTSPESPLVASLLRASDAFARARLLGEPVWLEELRRDALAAFSESGLPTTRHEEWRYTNIAKLARSQASVPVGTAAPTREQIASLAPGLETTRRLVFVDGRLSPQLSSDLGDDCHSLAALRTAGNADETLRSRLTDPERLKGGPFAALATAFLDDGLVVRIPANTLLAETIHVVFASTGTATEGELVFSHPRVAVSLETGARASVVQEHVSLGDGARFVNATVELNLAANAELDHVMLQRECDASSLVSTTTARVARDARLRSHVVTSGGGLVRNNLTAVLGDQGADCQLNGLFVAGASRHVDNHTTVDHAMPNGTSRELYKGILQDDARGVFRGRVIVRPDAQHTNAEQSNPNLLLSDGAEIDTKPQLEIYADDVKCSHGSTVGQMDPQALFYLRSRGLAEPDARAMLTLGFASEIVDALPHAGLRERVGTEVVAALAAETEALDSSSLPSRLPRPGGAA